MQRIGFFFSFISLIHWVYSMHTKFIQSFIFFIALPNEKTNKSLKKIFYFRHYELVVYISSIIHPVYQNIRFHHKYQNKRTIKQEGIITHQDMNHYIQVSCNFKLLSPYLSLLLWNSNKVLKNFFFVVKIQIIFFGLNSCFYYISDLLT